MILLHNMSAAGENFCIGVVRLCEYVVLPPCRGWSEGGVGSLRGDKGGVVSRQDPVGGTLPLREGDFALQN